VLRGHDARQPRHRGDLPALDNLLFFASLYDLDSRLACRAAGQALELVGLTDRGRDKVQTFSGGMKRRLNLAVALVHDPQIVLLDEPTVGVDPQSRNAIFDNLETLKRRGKTLLYTTHYMEEAERLCDRVVIIDRGKVVANDTLQGLYRLMPASNVVAIELEDQATAPPLDRLRALPGVASADFERGVLRVAVSDLTSGTARVLQWLGEGGYACRHVLTERADLETVFLALTGRKLRD